MRLAFAITLLLLNLGVSGQYLADTLTAELQAHQEDSSLPGFAVAVVDAGGVIYHSGFGLADRAEERPFTPYTLLNVGSVSKTVTGLAVIKAVQAGKLSLDTEINTILPFEVIHPYHPDVAITLRHLVTHRSGITDTRHYGKSYVRQPGFDDEDSVDQGFLEFLNEHEEMPLPDFLAAILTKKGRWYKKKNFLRAAPGTEQEYANLNAALAAYVVELATGISFAEFTRREIFEPLGLRFSGWDVTELPRDSLASLYSPQGIQVSRYRLITYPDGGLYTSVDDLAVLLQEMITAFQGNSHYLPAEYARLLLPGDDDGERAFWGMGSKSRNIGHGGSDPGVQADLQFNADRKIGRIILANMNAEDDEARRKEYRGIHDILVRYEKRLAEE